MLIIQLAKLPLVLRLVPGIGTLIFEERESVEIPGVVVGWCGEMFP